MKTSHLLSLALFSIHVSGMRTPPEDGEIYIDEHTTQKLNSLFPHLGLLREKETGEQYVIYDIDSFLETHKADAKKEPTMELERRPRVSEKGLKRKPTEAASSSQIAQKSRAAKSGVEQSKSKSASSAEASTHHEEHEHRKHSAPPGRNKVVKESRRR